MDWNFQSLKYLDKEKVGVEKHNSKKGFEKNEYACSMEGVLVV